MHRNQEGRNHNHQPSLKVCVSLKYFTTTNFRWCSPCLHDVVFQWKVWQLTASLIFRPLLVPSHWSVQNGKLSNVLSFRKGYKEQEDCRTRSWSRQLHRRVRWDDHFERTSICDFLPEGPTTRHDRQWKQGLQYQNMERSRSTVRWLITNAPILIEHLQMEMREDSQRTQRIHYMFCIIGLRQCVVEWESWSDNKGMECGEIWMRIRSRKSDQCLFTLSIFQHSTICFWFRQRPNLSLEIRR